MLEKVIKSLTDMMNKPLSLRDHNEREQAWIDLLNANKLRHIKLDDLLELALAAKCYRVVEYLYELQKDYENILQCYLNDSVRKMDIFNYISNYINDSERCIQEQFLINFKALITLNCKKTSEIVIEHYSTFIEQFCAMLDNEFELQYNFLTDIINNGDIKLPPQLAERYLEQLCVKNKNSASSYVQLSLCRIEEALNITRKYEAHSATALLLEQGGEWMEALELLLQHEMIDDGVSLCIRGAEHLDGEGAQKLWLKLLQHSGSSYNASLRQLLHAAAPHVPPAQLLELVSNANFGDVRVLLSGMLSDYAYDIEMLTTTLKSLGKDLHHSEYFLFYKIIHEIRYH